MIRRRDFMKAGAYFGVACVAGPGLAEASPLAPQLHVLADRRFSGAASLLRSANGLAVSEKQCLAAPFAGGADLSLVEDILSETVSMTLLGVTSYSDRLLFEGLARSMRRPFSLVGDERRLDSEAVATLRERLRGLRRDMVIPDGLDASLLALAHERGASVWFGRPRQMNPLE